MGHGDQYMSGYMSSWAGGGMWVWTVLGLVVVVLGGFMLWKQTRR